MTLNLKKKVTLTASQMLAENNRATADRLTWAAPNQRNESPHGAERAGKWPHGKNGGRSPRPLRPQCTADEPAHAAVQASRRRVHQSVHRRAGAAGDFQRADECCDGRSGRRKLGDGVIIITIMVLISGILRFVQETRQRQCRGEALRDDSHDSLRDARGREEGNPAGRNRRGRHRVAVCGDMLPADVRSPAANDLFLQPSSLTGK